jgi:lipopolysaccharide heptosyltransferase I
VAQRILIIKPSSLGDVATTLPVACDLKRAYPNAQIDWLIHPALTALIQGHDAIREAIPFERKRLASWWYKPSSTKMFRQLLKKIRSNKYDLVIDAQGLFRSGFLARYSGAKIRIGFASAREGATIFYTRKVKLEDGGKNMVAVDRMRALLQPLEIDTKSPAEFRLPIQKDAAEKISAILPGNEKFAAIIPGARWDTKRWSIEGYTQIAHRLGELNLRPVLLGSPDEKPLCDQMESALAGGFDAINLAGKTNLAEMIAALARARLVIGNDSGPLHVAVALGKPAVSIYGPTSENFVGPYGQIENVIRHDVECHPCRRKFCDHHSCMKGVTVEVVWEKTAQLARAAAEPKR